MKKVENQETKELKKLKEEAGEFKKFISRGNVVDMAVGVIIGGAFGNIVTSLVQDMLMPLIGVILGGLNFESLSIQVGSANIAYGLFIQTIVDFLIISFSIFVMVKIIERLRRKQTIAKEKEKSDEVVLLEEIRDLLKSKVKEEK